MRMQQETITTESYVRRPSTASLQPPSRAGTVFPANAAANSTHNSSLLSETLGAFGEVNLSRQPSTSTIGQMPSSAAHRLPDGSVVLQLPPYRAHELNRPTSYKETQPLAYKSYSQHSHLPSYEDMPQQDKVYRPTTEPMLGSFDSERVRTALELQTPERHYDKFTDVVSNSGDTVELARNVGSYMSDKIPPCAWFGLMAVTCVIGFVILLIGSFNIPFCNVQPMIPIWMLVLGVLIILSSCIRIYASIPMPSTRRGRNAQQARAARLSSDLCIKGTELILFLAIIIWVILGAVWVYGSKWYVHFEERMSEQHYCDAGLYWTAFSVVTGSLVCIALIVLGILLIMMGSAMKSG